MCSCNLFQLDWLGKEKQKTKEQHINDEIARLTNFWNCYSPNTSYVRLSYDAFDDIVWVIDNAYELTHLAFKQNTIQPVSSNDSLIFHGAQPILPYVAVRDKKVLAMSLSKKDIINSVDVPRDKYTIFELDSETILWNKICVLSKLYTPEALFNIV